MLIRAERDIVANPSVRLSVCLSVCLSVRQTLVLYLNENTHRQTLSTV